MVEVFADGGGLLAGALRVGGQIAVLPVLFHLLWRRVLAVDLEAGLLSAGSQVRLGAVRERAGMPSRPRLLRAGDGFRFDGRLHTVAALEGTAVRLVDEPRWSRSRIRAIGCSCMRRRDPP
ncbi:hypothetical protein [Streptomyces bobili]|uniref:hypothetical protein n=1 Tax=Streptomyces bobili TaxID=67280 RepID=UPI001FC93641|nr:hypothetical protein [Streptomyces bobili]